MWDRTKLDGVDISTFQPEQVNGHRLIDWTKAIAAGLKFCVARASFVEDGVIKLDPRFAEHADRVLGMGVDLGGYHYFGPSGDETFVRDQAKRFVDACGARITLAGACDLETKGRGTGLDPNALADATECFLEAVDALTTRRTWLYVGPFFTRDNLREQSGRFSARLLWLPEYGPAEPEIPRPFYEAQIWQAMGDGDTCPGFPGAVDRNVLGQGVTIEQLRSGIKAAPSFDLDETRGLQGALRYLGYEIGDFVDGKLGARTAFAVAAFQRRANLVPDGVVGDATLAALVTELEQITPAA